MITELLKSKIINDFQNTDLGFVRIKKNLDILNFSNEQVKNHCKNIIQNTVIDDFKKIGKNYYIRSKKYNAILTINSFTLTVITAKQIIKRK